MDCESCEQYIIYNFCLTCGKINQGISQNIQDHHKRIEMAAHPETFKFLKLNK